MASSSQVLEETGVKTEFKSILSFRHQHNVSFGRSDMYVPFVASMWCYSVGFWWISFSNGHVPYRK